MGCRGLALWGWRKGFFCPFPVDKDKGGDTALAVFARLPLVRVHTCSLGLAAKGGEDSSGHGNPFCQESTWHESLPTGH